MTLQSKHMNLIHTSRRAIPPNKSNTPLPLHALALPPLKDSPVLLERNATRREALPLLPYTRIVRPGSTRTAAAQVKCRRRAGGRGHSPR